MGNPSPAEARDAGIGVVYQELSLLPGPQRSARTC